MSESLSRHGRRILSGLTAAVMLTVPGCGHGPPDDGGPPPDLPAATGPPESRTVTVGALPITDLKQLFVADAEGLFRREGLEVRIRDFAGGAAIVPAVQSGTLDIGWSNSVSVIQARERGLTVRFFGGGLYQGPGHWTSAIMVPAGSPITRAEQLRGRNVAVNTLGNINELALRAYLDRAGTKPDAVTYAEVAFPDQPAALARRHVDAAMPTEPFVTVAKQSGARVLDAEPFTAIGPRPFVAAFFARDQWLRTNPNTAAAFRRAIAAATHFWNDHPERHADIIARYTKVPLELARQITYGEPSTDIAPADVQTEIELSRKYGLIRKTIDAHEVLTE